MIDLPADLLDSPLWNDEIAFRVWLTCCIMAGNKGRIETTLKEVRDKAFPKRRGKSQPSVSTVRRALKWLETQGKLTQRMTQRQQALTVCIGQHNDTPLFEDDAEVGAVMTVRTTPKLTKLDQNALEVLAYFNEKAGKGLRKPSAELRARLREGALVDECKAVIDYKVAEWKGDDHMEKHLNLVTLFRPSKYENYLQQVVSGLPPTPPNRFGGYGNTPTKPTVAVPDGHKWRTGDVQDDNERATEGDLFSDPPF